MARDTSGDYSPTGGRNQGGRPLTAREIWEMNHPGQPYKPPEAYEFNYQGGPQPVSSMPAANACGAPGSWEADFGAAHGRCPNDQDRADRDWSLDFQARYGRPPSQADWERHYYEGQGIPQEDGGDGWTGTVAELLTQLEFPKTNAELPAYLRGWGQYAQQLFQENPSMGIFPLPEIVNGEVARFEKEPGDREKLGQATTNPAQTLQGLLGFAQGEGELGKRSAAEQWQTLFNAMKHASPEAMQQLASLRYNPDLADWDHGTSGWYRKLINALPHVEHL
jgi:hypothetical protein